LILIDIYSLDTSNKINDNIFQKKKKINAIRIGSNLEIVHRLYINFFNIKASELQIATQTDFMKNKISMLLEALDNIPLIEILMPLKSASP